MSSFNLAKKLKPAKQAWNSFTIQVKYKFNNFSISKTINNSKKYCISSLHKIRSLIPHKIFDLIRSRRRCRYHLYHHHRCHHPPMKSRFETVYIDELFRNNSFDDEQPKIVIKKTSSVASSSSVSISLPKGDGNKLEKKEQVCSNNKIVVSKGVKILENKKGETSKSIIGNDDGLKLSLLSKFRGIDERAEEFISKFKEDMKLESEKSILDYQEMLARSV